MTTKTPIALLFTHTTGRTSRRSLATTTCIARHHSFRTRLANDHYGPYHTRCCRFATSKPYIDWQKRHASNKIQQQQSKTSTSTAPSILFHTNPTSSTTAAAAESSTTIHGVSKWQALRSLFITGAIPMVGFGFMDNVVMIQAGQYIDSTIGVQLGLATLTAAACGQIVSDVSGVLFGGTLERLVGKVAYFRKHAVISTQARQAIPQLARNVTLAGAVVGVICGCALGASTLVFMDLEARDRIHHANQLREIVCDMLETGPEEHCLAGTAACTLHVTGAYAVDASRGTTDTSKMVRLAFLKNDSQQQVSEKSAVQTCAAAKDVVIREGCLCAPILRGQELVAVLEFHDDSLSFTQEHATAAKVMAHHLGIVMKHLVES